MSVLSRSTHKLKIDVAICLVTHMFCTHAPMSIPVLMYSWYNVQYGEQVLAMGIRVSRENKIWFYTSKFNKVGGVKSKILFSRDTLKGEVGESSSSLGRSVGQNKSLIWKICEFWDTLMLSFWSHSKMKNNSVDTFFTVTFKQNY